VWDDLATQITEEAPIAGLRIRLGKTGTIYLTGRDPERVRRAADALQAAAHLRRDDPRRRPSGDDARRGTPFGASLKSLPKYGGAASGLRRKMSAKSGMRASANSMTEKPPPERRAPLLASARGMRASSRPGFHHARETRGLRCCPRLDSVSELVVQVVLFVLVFFTSDIDLGLSLDTAQLNGVATTGLIVIAAVLVATVTAFAVPSLRQRVLT
jgi:hypothetical protein